MKIDEHIFQALVVVLLATVVAGFILFTLATLDLCGMHL